MQGGGLTQGSHSGQTRRSAEIRRATRWAALAWLVAATLFSSGCRDALFDGERVGDKHIVRGGPAARLSSAELARGRFVSTNEDLVPLQTLLRSRIKLFAQAGDIGAPVDRLRAFAESEALGIYDPVEGETDTNPSRLGAQFVDIEADRFRTQYIALCNDPVLDAVFPPRGPPAAPCDPLNPNFEGLADALLLQLTLTSAPGRTTVQWAAPSNRDSERALDDDYIVPRPTDPPLTCARCASRFVCPPGGTPDTACVFETTRSCARDADCFLADAQGDDSGWGRCVAAAGGARQCDFSQLRQIAFDVSPTAPVLSANVSFDADTDLNDFFAPLVLSVRVTRADLNLRLQPLPCARPGLAGACTDRTGLVFAGRRGPSPTGDLVRADIGLDISARGVPGQIDTAVTPGVVCFLLPSICTIAATVAVFDLRANARRSLIRSGRNLAASLEQAIEVPSLVQDPGKLTGSTVRTLCNAQNSAAICDMIDAPGDTVEDDDGNLATLDPFDAFAAALSIDLGVAQVRLTPVAGEALRIVQLGAAGGAFSDRTLDVLSRGGDVVSVTSDLTALAAVCGTENSASDPLFIANCVTPPIANNLCNACTVCQTFGARRRVLPIRRSAGQLSLIRHGLAVPHSGISGRRGSIRRRAHRWHGDPRALRAPVDRRRRGNRLGHPIYRRSLLQYRKADPRLPPRGDWRGLHHAGRGRHRWRRHHG